MKTGENKNKNPPKDTKKKDVKKGVDADRPGHG